MLTLGQYSIRGPLFLAPMAGVTDRAFRRLCRLFGANYGEGEMVASSAQLRDTAKSRARMVFDEDEAPRVVQLLGADPESLADAFYWAVDCGAQVVDFNMGCPAKKVCTVACGSALMQREDEARAIFKALGQASVKTGIPVTLKCRTGWDEAHKNAVTLALAAQDEGFSMVTVHGRTRAGGFIAPVDYEAVRDVVKALTIPVVVNGDIVDAASAARAMAVSQAAAMMIGRGALGRPWVFKEIAASLAGASVAISREEKIEAIWQHRAWHFADYEEVVAVRTFRKHLLWYLNGWKGFEAIKADLCAAEDEKTQRTLLTNYFSRLA